MKLFYLQCAALVSALLKLFWGFWIEKGLLFLRTKSTHQLWSVANHLSTCSQCAGVFLTFASGAQCTHSRLSSVMEKGSLSEAFHWTNIASTAILFCMLKCKGRDTQLPRLALCGSHLDWESKTPDIKKIAFQAYQWVNKCPRPLLQMDQCWIGRI